MCWDLPPCTASALARCSLPAGVFGPPADRDEALAVLRRAATPASTTSTPRSTTGRTSANELIREALHPYPDGLALVSKVGAAATTRAAGCRGTGRTAAAGIEDNLRSLGTGQLAVVNLRLIDGAPPDQLFDEQLAAMVQAREDGLIGGVGLSNVTLGQLRHALAAPGSPACRTR